MGLLNKKPFKMPTFDNEHEEDIEPVQNEVAVENKPIESINDAIKNVIKKSMGADGLVKGLNQVGKALDKRSAYLSSLLMTVMIQNTKNSSLASPSKTKSHSSPLRRDKISVNGSDNANTIKKVSPERLEVLLPSPSSTMEKTPRLLPTLNNTSRITTFEEFDV